MPGRPAQITRPNHPFSAGCPLLRLEDVSAPSAAGSRWVCVLLMRSKEVLVLGSSEADSATESAHRPMVPPTRLAQDCPRNNPIRLDEIGTTTMAIPHSPK